MLGTFVMLIGKVSIPEQSLHGWNDTSTNVFYHLGNKGTKITPYEVMYREPCDTIFILGQRQAAVFGKILFLFLGNLVSTGYIVVSHIVRIAFHFTGRNSSEFELLVW